MLTFDTMFEQSVLPATAKQLHLATVVQGKSWTFSDQDGTLQTPDLVIEVVWTSGGIDKLEAYRRLGVPEVWFWKNDRIHIHLLEKEREGAPAHYRTTTESACLAGLDLALLLSALDRPTAMQAVRTFRAALAAHR